MNRRNRIVFFLALLAMTLAPNVQAAPVDALRASRAARSFFQNDPAGKGRQVRIAEVAYAPAMATKAGAPALYIYNRVGGGFVILAGDDACRPVLGYSFSEKFFDPSDMPQGARDWLEDLIEQVELVRAGGDRASAAAKASWAAVEAPTKASGKLYATAHKFETPRWGQNAPFNGLAPTVEGKQAVAGCVPLAMSMICRFFKYPAKGVGTLPEYSYTADDKSTVTIPGFELGHAYDWDHIKMDYSEYTEEEAAAVARLVYDCGVIVQAKYGGSETSANTGNMISKAIEHLGFDAGARFLNRGFYSDEVWASMLMEELQHRPVLYSARREGNYGHTFLLDGFNGEGDFSINWGWKGTGNGYYALSSFAYSEQRAYIYKHAGCFGIKPDEGGIGECYLFLTTGTSSSSGNSYNGLTPLTEPVPICQPFKMKIGALTNGGNMPYSAYFIVAVTDKDGNIKDFACGSQLYNTTNPRSWRGYPGVDCIVSIYPREGDKLKLFYCSEDEMTMANVPWKPVLWDATEDVTGEIPLHDTYKLAEVTSLAYNKVSGIVTIETKDSVTWKLEGGTVPDGTVTYTGTTLSIDSSQLKKGDYRLTLVRDKDKLELEITMGQK